MKLKFKFLILAILVIAIGSYFFVACTVSPPKIVDCSQVKYKGITWSLDQCSGATSGTVIVTTTQNGKTVTFTLTCSNGCISAVTATDPVI